MPFIGNKPSAVPLTSADIADGIIVNADINTNAAITTEKLNLISTASVASVTAKGTPSVSDGYIQLNCEQNSHGIKIKSPPHSAGANYTLVMPSTTGTANQVLRMNSGATALEFASASSDFVKLLSTSASASAAVSIDGYFTSTFDKYVLYLNGGYMSTSNRINLKVNKSGTAQTGSYTHTAFGQTNQPTSFGLSETDYFHMGYFSNSSSRTNDAVIQIFNPLGTTYAKGFIWNIGGKDNAYDLWTGGAGYHNSNTAISGVTILNQAGHTFTIDKITLYGIK